jgi:predicted peptidase
LTVKTPKAEVGAIVDELMARGSLPSVRNASALTEARTYTNADGATLGYRFHAPAKVEQGRRYPLVLFLHGAGERGDDNVLQQIHGVWPILSYMKEKKIDGYLIAPQCPKGKKWVDTPWDAASHTMPKNPSESMKLVLELLDKTLKECPVDAQRVYVTGLSMGGYGTWDIVQRYPKLFAAAMPLCGGGDSTLARVIREVPIWAFHGDCDKAVPVKRSRQMVSALWECDGNVRYREYPGVGHNCWDAAYSDVAVLDWFFSQTRK